MKVSVIIPVYNEEKTIEKVVEGVRSIPLDKEIIIVDDCSCDRTREILTGLARRYPEIRVVYSNPNRGKGYAIKYGFKFAKGDIVLIQDADLEYNPSDYLKIVSIYAQENADVVYGSRFLGVCKNMTFLQWGANVFFNLLTNLIHHRHLTDTCTCYKSFRTHIIKDLPLESDGFEICHEINAKLLKNGYAIKEVPINYCARTHKEGKKVGWRTFFSSTWAILKYGLFAKNNKL